MSTALSYNPRRIWAFSFAVILASAAAAIKAIAGGHTAKSSIVTVSGDGLSSLSNATGWINSTPLTANSLQGKVVLINFCTYTCINWLRILPYVRAWADKYKDQGLVVIGVHTPEFSFEKNMSNVQWAIKDRKITYPIATDNNYEIWNAFSNQYWPALYFIDAKGHIRHQQFGEGQYEESEKFIQQLLMEAGAKGINKEMVTVDAPGPEAAADWNNLQSGENYVGYDRTENFSSPGGALSGKQHVYSLPKKIRLNQWALTGDWTFQKEAVSLNTANGRIVYHFHARDVHLVMGPATPGAPIRFRVLIDGKAPGTAHGGDTDSEGNGILKEQRMYQLIRQAGTITDKQFEIEFLDAGAEAFAFTFG